jgi:hypothetical protein
MIKILGLFGQIWSKIITHNYTLSNEKQIKDIRYALVRLITANNTQLKLVKIKIFFKFLLRNYALLSAKA